MVQGRRRFGTIASYLVGLIALQVVLFGVLIGYGAFQDFHHARIDAVASMTTTAKAASHFVAEDLQSNVDSVKGVPDLLKTFSVAQICASLQQSETQPLDDRWTVTDVHLVHEDGSPACGFQKKQPNVRGQSWFKKSMGSTDVVTTGPVMDGITKQRALIWSMDAPDKHLIIAISARLDT